MMHRGFEKLGAKKHRKYRKPYEESIFPHRERGKPYEESISLPPLRLLYAENPMRKAFPASRRMRQ
jgi:hypothetical protein